MKESFVLLKADIGDDVMMHRYSPEIKRGNGAVVIFTGGAYARRAPHEAEPYALILNEMGIEAFVVDYRVAPFGHPLPLTDARCAVSLVRHNAEKWGIDPQKIAVMGSSAGGHLAALCATSKERLLIPQSAPADYTPNAQILCYPVTDKASHGGSYENLIGENNSEKYKEQEVNPIALADESTPPAFIWHTSSDPSVDVKGTYRYATRLSELGVPVEMHVYPVGGHGLGLANGLYGRDTEVYVQRWIKDLECWLKLIKWINE